MIDFNGFWAGRRALWAFFLGLFWFSPFLNARAEGPFEHEFWKHWGDGKAELSGYELITPRYGAPRKGVGIMIFVTEPFSNALRVKADPGRHEESDVVQVMKLNLIRDFPTGVYDYNVMTSVFVGLESFDGLRPGDPAKVSFSAQEWCGHVYEQILFHKRKIDVMTHSYFDGEADRKLEMDWPQDAISEDALFLWARGHSSPFLSPGQTVALPMLLSTLTARFHHVSPSLRTVELSRSKRLEEVTVPAGVFVVRKMSVKSQQGTSWTFYVEDKTPFRIISWKNSDGEEGRFLKSNRLAYWQLNGPEFRSEVSKLGLLIRPLRTP